MISLIAFFVGLVVGYQLYKLSHKCSIEEAARVDIKIGPISNKEK